MNLNKIVARNIKYIRILNSITQEYLANNMGINQSHISAIEKGTKTISLARLEEIAKILNVEPYILLKKDLQKEAKDKILK